MAPQAVASFSWHISFVILSLISHRSPRRHGLLFIRYPRPFHPTYPRCFCKQPTPDFQSHRFLSQTAAHHHDILPSDEPPQRRAAGHILTQYFFPPYLARQKISSTHILSHAALIMGVQGADRVLAATTATDSRPLSLGCLADANNSDNSLLRQDQVPAEMAECGHRCRRHVRVLVRLLYTSCPSTVCRHD